GLQTPGGQAVQPGDLDDEVDPAALEVEGVAVLPGAVDDQLAEEPQRRVARGGVGGEVGQEDRRALGGGALRGGELGGEGRVAVQVAQVEEHAGLEHRLRRGGTYPAGHVVAPGGQRLAPARVGRHFLAAAAR